ncbi:MAG: hypothetical protein IKN38_00875 [Clostridia bacterium]|nr:hypothetical protein [Clostridia bacterium]
MSQDTVKLLRECDAGVKTAVNSIDEILSDIKSEDLRRIMDDSRLKHQSLGDEIHSELLSLDEKGKDPSPVARAMTWMKINFKMTEKPTDSTIAELMYDGCSMGVKSLAKYLNQYEAAEHSAKSFAKHLIEIEDTLMTDLRTFM